jgi:hypothetical protein
MFFKNKKENSRKCENCGTRSDEKFSFCPFCGNSFIDPMKEKLDYGLLGKNDMEENAFPIGNSGFTDKLFNSLLSTMMKSLDKQLQNQFKDFNNSEKTEIKTLPNGIRIKISGPFMEKPEKQIKALEIKPEKLKRMSSLPREKAKTNVKRLGDKIVYELSTPGVSSREDIFISKLESGYEIKAIGDSKVYVNSIPLNLPLKKYSITDNKLSVEFFSKENFE